MRRPLLLLATLVPFVLCCLPLTAQAKPQGQEPGKAQPGKAQPGNAQPEKPEPGKAGEPGKPGENGKPGEPGKDAGGPAAAEGAWLTDFEAAKARAKKERKAILADFTGSDWCHWCQQLDKEVFATPEFQKWAEKNVVLLQLDFPRQKELPKELKEQNAALAKQFHIQGYPTIVFLNAKGERAGEMGYQEGGPEKWTKDADKLVKKAKSK